MELDATSFWRLLNVCLSLVTLVALLLDTHDRLYELSKRRLYLTFALMMTIFAVMVGSIEGIISHAPLRLGTGLYTAACLWCLFGLWVSRDEPTKK